MFAAACIFDLMTQAEPRCLEVVQSPVDLAEADELGLVGASELEHPVHFGHLAKFIDGIVEGAREDPRFAAAVAGPAQRRDTTSGEPPPCRVRRDVPFPPRTMCARRSVRDKNRSYAAPS